jgi:hypothetical protein
MAWCELYSSDAAPNIWRTVKHDAEQLVHINCMYWRAVKHDAEQLVHINCMYWRAVKHDAEQLVHIKRK